MRLASAVAVVNSEKSGEGVGSEMELAVERLRCCQLEYGFRRAGEA